MGGLFRQYESVTIWLVSFSYLLFRRLTRDLTLGHASTQSGLEFNSFTSKDT
jgi:hypothetical protein